MHHSTDSRCQVACPIMEKWRTKLTNQIDHTQWHFSIAWLVSLDLFFRDGTSSLKSTVYQGVPCNNSQFYTIINILFIGNNWLEAVFGFGSVHAGGHLSPDPLHWCASHKTQCSVQLCKYAVSCVPCCVCVGELLLQEIAVAGCDLDHNEMLWTFTTIWLSVPYLFLTFQIVGSLNALPIGLRWLYIQHNALTLPHHTYPFCIHIPYVAKLSRSIIFANFANGAHSRMLLARNFVRTCMVY